MFFEKRYQTHSQVKIVCVTLNTLSTYDCCTTLTLQTVTARKGELKLRGNMAADALNTHLTLSRSYIPLKCQDIWLKLHVNSF